MKRLILASLVVLALTAPARAQEAAVRPAELEVAFDGPTPATQSLRVRVADGWTLGGVKLIDVTRGTRRDPAFRQAFTVTAAAAAPASMLDVALVKSVGPGSYRLVIVLEGVRTAAADAGARTQSFEHTIIATVAAPVIDAPAAVHVAVTDRIFGSDAPDASPVVVVEKSGRAGVTGLKIEQVMPLASDGKLVRGRVKVTIGETVGAGGRVQATVTQAERFVLGTSAGTLELRADHLDQPRSIPLNVTRRRTGWLVFWLFVLGLAIGWVVRIAAKAVLDLDEVRTEAADVRRQLEEAARRSLAPEAKKLADATVAIDGAGNRASVVRQAVAAARTKLGEVATKHGEQLTTLHSELEARARIEVLRNLPDAVAAIVAQAIADLDGAEAATLEADVAAATASRERLDAHVALARGRLATDTQPLGDELARVLRVAQVAPTDCRAPLQALAAHATALAGIATAGDARQALVDGDKALQSIGRDTRAAAVALTGFADDTSVTLASFPSLAAKIAAATAVELVPGDHEANVRRLRAAVLATRSAVAAIVRDVAEAEAKLAEHDYAGALTAFAAVTEPEVRSGKSAGMQPPAAKGLAPAAEPPPAHPAPRRAPFARPAAPPPSAPSRWVWPARVVRVAFALAILPLGAWWLYEASFVGTIREMIAICATGFLTDISFEAALSSLEKLRKTG